MGPSCAPLLVDFFFYSYVRQSLYTSLSKTKELQTPKPLIDDNLKIDNPNFAH